MKSIWSVIGVIVLIVIVVVIYNKYSASKIVVEPKTPAIAPVKNTSGSTTQRTNTETVIVQPVFISTGTLNCNSSAYQNGVADLFDVYRQKRVIYNNGIASNDPNVITYHRDMDVAYNSYYNEAAKCNFFIG